MQIHFDKDLNNLKHQLVEMSAYTEKMIALSIQALLNKDEDAIHEIEELEKLVNQRDVSIENFAITLIARHQPTAGDLRFIISVIEMSNSLERIGDLAVNIMERCEKISADVVNFFSQKLNDISSIAQSMVSDAIQSFISGDADKAVAVCLSDDKVDELKEIIFKQSANISSDYKDELESLIDIVIVSRQYERIADLATNIAEDVLYHIKGKIVRHHFNDN